MKHLSACLFTLFFGWTASLQGQIVINEIRASDSHVELRNNGIATVNIGTYWLCRFPDYSQLSALPIICGVDLNLEAGAIVTVDLPYSLDAGDDELALYVSADFALCISGTMQNMIDYVEWGSHGHTRSSVAECEGIWLNNDFVPSWDDCVSLEYDGSGNASSNWFPQDVPTMPCMGNNLNGCGLMPLDLLSFHASQVDNGAAINWNAVHDNTVRVILLEHSDNAEDWKTMTQWQPTGPDFDRGEYHHQNIASGTHYYRLLIQYSDGLTEFSPIATLHICYDTDQVSIWPNPSSNIINVFVQSIELLVKAEFQIVDTHGKICISQWGSHQVQMDLSLLPEGVYFLHIPALGIVHRVVKT